MQDKAIKAAPFIKAAQLLQLSLVLRGFLNIVIFPATGESVLAAGVVVFWLCLRNLRFGYTSVKVTSNKMIGGFHINVMSKCWKCEHFSSLRVDSCFVLFSFACEHLCM